jgi:hypothetical protein
MRIGIGIGEISGAPATLDNLVAQAQRAEREGFASGWFANIFGFDAIMAAALCGRATSRIELGTAVVPTYPRHPTAMAQQAHDVDPICGPRETGVHTSLVSRPGLSGRSRSRVKCLAVLAPLIRTSSVSYQGTVRVNASRCPGPPCSIPVAALALDARADGREDGTITWMTGPNAASIPSRINGRLPPGVHSRAWSSVCQLLTTEVDPRRARASSATAPCRRTAPLTAKGPGPACRDRRRRVGSRRTDRAPARSRSPTISPSLVGGDAPTRSVREVLVKLLKR